MQTYGAFWMQWVVRKMLVFRVCVSRLPRSWALAARSSVLGQDAISAPLPYCFRKCIPAQCHLAEKGSLELALHNRKDVG